MFSKHYVKAKTEDVFKKSWSSTKTNVCLVCPLVQLDFNSFVFSYTSVNVFPLNTTNVWRVCLFIYLFWAIFLALLSQTITFTLQLHTCTGQKQPPECSIKIGVLKNFPKFTGKHLCESLFFNKAADLRVSFLIKLQASDLQPY